MTATLNSRYQQDSFTGERSITYAVAAQVNVITSFKLNQNIDVYIGGVQQSTGFSWVAGGTTVTFAAPFLGGEEVIIDNR
jgi:hypothetical protein